LIIFRENKKFQIPKKKFWVQRVWPVWEGILSLKIQFVSTGQRIIPILEFFF